MQSDRYIGHAPRTTAMGRQMMTIQGPCIGCKGCQGLCATLIEAMTLPETILNRGD